MRQLVGDRKIDRLAGGCLGDRLRRAIDRSPQMESPASRPGLRPKGPDLGLSFESCIYSFIGHRRQIQDLITTTKVKLKVYLRR